MRDLDRRMLLLATRAALRGAGRVEPNPLVGCAPGAPDGRVLGIGHHRRYGGPHAEVEAIVAAHRLGNDVGGCIAWVTLEPCCHHGKTGPCTEALVRAGVGEVVVARRDPSAISGGGMERLRAAGVSVRETGVCPEAARLSDPFVKRVTAGLPWVIAKWAQTIDGRLATRTGDSRWISNERSRREVHRLRARVDAVLTGIGTVLADDPMLTARDAPVRRIARRVVLDPALQLPEASALARTARQIPVSVFTSESAHRAGASRAGALRAAGVEVVAVPGDEAALDLAAALHHLASVHEATNVLVEAGPRLLGGLIERGLVDEAHVFTAPVLLGDAAAPGPVIGAHPAATIADAMRYELRRVRRFGGDVLLVYARLPGAA